jgi:outer membrane receptor for ferrienterochelin and colicins
MGVRTRFLLVGALTMLALRASAVQAQTGSIAGRVTSAESGLPVANARVEARAVSGGIPSIALTSQDGRYRISGLSSGTYNLSVSALAFGSRTTEGLQVSEGETVTADVTLEIKVFDLDPLVISASKQPEKAVSAPSRTEVVSEADIAVRPAVTPVDHLRSTAGVDVVTAGVQSTFVVVRGFNNIFSGALHTLTDNRIAGIPSLRVNLMHFIPQTNEDISRMEVVLGPGAALYGPNTANGVLHIITKSPLEEQGTTATVAGGERSIFHGTFRSSHLLSENFGVKVSGQYVRGNEWVYTDTIELNTRALADTAPAVFRATQALDVNGQPLSEAEIQRRIPLIANRDFDIQRWSADARADWRVTPNLGLIFSAGRTVVANGIELTGIGAGQVKDWAYSYYQLRARTGRLFAQAYLNTSDAGETFLLRSGAPIVDRSKVFVGQLQHGTELGNGRARLTYGADFIRTMPETERTINGANEDDDNYTELGAYLQAETRLTRSLDLVLAGRIDDHSELEDPVWSPRAALVFHPAENQSIRVTYNRAFSTPTSLNLFLDLDGGPAGALGPFGFRARAQAPGRTGFSFRGGDGLLHGVRSPFAPGLQMTAADLIPVTVANIYDLQATGLRAALLAQGLPDAVVTPVVGAIRALKAHPNFQTLTLNTLDPVAGMAPLTGTSIDDVPGINESISNVFEVGYKGILGDRLLLAADVWHERKTNFTSPLILQTPLILVNPQQLVPFLVEQLTPVVGQAAAQQFAAGMAQIPGGVISSPDVSVAAPNLVFTYRNFGEVKLTGFDVSATALLSDRLQLGLTGSIAGDDHFIVPLEGQRDQIVALNAPKRKATANVNYREAPFGLNGEVRMRHTAEFPVNSADYVGTECVGGVGECVSAATLFDITAGYVFRTLPGVSLSLTVQNVFNEAYTSFIGVPTVGRLGMLRLKYEFGRAR